MFQTGFVSSEASLGLEMPMSSLFPVFTLSSLWTSVSKSVLTGTPVISLGAHPNDLTFTQ